ncbi:hypothetical protein DV735_g246, partial [Chaetothyriales sp. CBS 134920]
MRFFTFFQHEITQLQSQIDRLADLPTVGGERSDAAEHCLAAISRLSTEVQEASSYLPPYDQRTYAAAIKALQEKLQETKAAFAPKPKFSFKAAAARKSPSAISLSDAAVLAAQRRKAALLGSHSQNSHNNSHNVGSSSSSPGSTTPPEAAAKEADEAAAPRASTTSSTSRTISNQTHSHLVLPTSTSTSPSLRIHNSFNLHIYLHSTSRPIIENSSGIVFSPLPRQYAALLRPLLWHQVDDFQWLKATPSPNRSIDLSRDLDRRDDLWPHIVGGSSGGGDGAWSVDEILAAVGIASAS